MKKLLSLVLAFLFVLSMLNVSFAEEEIVDVTMFYSTSRSQSEYTDLTLKYIEDNLGIRLIVYPGSAAEWKQQLALYITSGEVPDIVAYMDTITWLEYAEQGIWYDLTQLVDEYPNIRPYVAKQTDDSETVWNRLKVDGKIYGIPYMAGCTCKYLNVLRADWMEKLGLEMPETLDDLTEILRAFTYDDPDGNGEDDTYGFGARSDIATLSEFFGAFGATTKEDTFLRDGKMITNVISEEYKNALIYLNEIYTEGLIHPEIFTMNDTQHYEEWVRSAFGVTTWWWTWAGNAINRYGFLDANPDADMAFFDPVEGPDGWSGHYAEDDISYVVAVSAKCENVEKVMEFIDWQATWEGYATAYLGPKGQFWEGDPATETLTWAWTLENKDALGNSINDMEYFKILGNNPMQNQTKLLLEPSVRNDILIAQTKYVTTATVYRNAFIGLTTPEYVSLSSETQKFFTDYTIKFITGEKSIDEEWDSYVEGYLTCGGEAVRQSLLEVYNANNGTNYTFGN